MSVLTVTSLILAILGAWTRLGWPRALALAGATPAGAALSLGEGIAVPTFDFVAIFAIGSSLLRFLRNRNDVRLGAPSVPGLLTLVVFGLWSAMVTLIAPVLFEGFAVTGPDIGAIHFLNSAIQPATSNVAQLGYLAIAIAVIAIVAKDRSTSIAAVGLTLITSTVLSYWALVHRDFGVPYPVGVFDNSPAFRYISTAAGGLERFRGIFPEPAALAVSGIGAVAFLLAALPRTRGRWRVGALLVLGMAVWNIAVSTATTAVVSGVVLALLAGGVLLVRFVLRDLRVSAGVGVAACIVASALIIALPIIANSIATTIGAKVDTASYDDRSSADNFSYGLLVRTYGFGVGLGSNRPSSFLAALLSTTGVVGGALFISAVIILLARSARIPGVRPVLWALVSLLISKIISAPDLGDPSGLTWMSLAVLAHAILERTGARPVPATRVPRRRAPESDTPPRSARPLSSRGRSAEPAVAQLFRRLESNDDPRAL